VEQFQLADETLFERVLNDDRFMCCTRCCLQGLNTVTTSDAEQPDYQLIAKMRKLNTNNFIIRMLYNNSY